MAGIDQPAGQPAGSQWIGIGIGWMNVWCCVERNAAQATSDRRITITTCRVLSIISIVSIRLVDFSLV